MKIIREADYIEVSDEGFDALIPCTIPKVEKKEISDDNIRFCYFYNPYFEAASKFCGVKNDKGFWGMLCPLCLFAVENSELYKDLKIYQHSMMFEGFLHYLIDSINNYRRVSKVKDGSDFQLDLNKHLYIFIYDRLVAEDMDSYIPSLYEKGFMYVDDPFDLNDYYKSQFKIDNLDYKKVIELSRFAGCFANFGFINTLFKSILTQKTNPAFRYLLLYQVIEYLMEIKKNEVLFNKLKESPDLFKNDLREDIHDVFKEESLIKLLYNGISCSSGFYADFCDIADNLFDKIKKKKPKSSVDFVGYMYGVRNAIVHNFKESASFGEDLTRLSELFEQAICELVISVKVDLCENLRLFVMDKSIPYKTNKKAMSEVYHDVKY